MITKSTAARNAACNAVVGLIDQSGINPTGSLNIYNASSNLMASLPLSYPSFFSATDGTAVANTIYDATCRMDGTISYFNFIGRDSSYVYGGSISKETGSGDMKLPVVALAQGATISISSATYVVP